ncbi:hypothetical protein CHR62_02765 [Pusillimonas sp. NJUB218]|nr:hypothetical protein CHR62_02765 [Pusillimonas sp. NJUB218]
MVLGSNPSQPTTKFKGPRPKDAALFVCALAVVARFASIAAGHVRFGTDGALPAEKKAPGNRRFFYVEVALQRAVV